MFGCEISIKDETVNELISWIDEYGYNVSVSQKNENILTMEDLEQDEEIQYYTLVDFVAFWYDVLINKADSYLYGMKESIKEHHTTFIRFMADLEKVYIALLNKEDDCISKYLDNIEGITSVVEKLKGE